MMRLLLLVAVASLTASAVGCTSMFNRGQPCGAPPCGTAATSPYMGAPTTISEGTYLPAPG